MGTLTAGQPRLAEYCIHKLPTSCRLSSIPECCACADERAHAAAYSTYIDGVGYVLRGSRWQRYCWFCKEFWENRVTASSLRPAQTRIPETPDQTTFLHRWYEFHQGYRTITKEDGTEEKIAVVGEDFSDVSPGCLPRTLDELRAGRTQSTSDELERTREQPAAVIELEPDLTLDQTLDQLMEEAQEEENRQNEQNRERNESNVHAQAMVARGNRLVRTQEYHTIRIAALRRELQRMRNGIERVTSGLRELGEAVPDSSVNVGTFERFERRFDAISSAASIEEARLAILSDRQSRGSTNAMSTDRDATSMQERIEQARDTANGARRMRDQSASEFQAAEEELRSAQSRLHQLQRDQRTQENYIRVFGTREEINAQGDAYESPIGGMFNSAWARFRDAENVRQEERTLRQFLADENASGGEEHMRRLTELESYDRDVWGVRRPRPSQSIESEPGQGIRHQGTSNTTQLMEMARDEVFAGQLTQSQTTAGSQQDQTDSSVDGRAGAGAGVNPEDLNRTGLHHGWSDPSRLLRVRHSVLSSLAADRVQGASEPGSVSEAPCSDTYELTLENRLHDLHFLLTYIAAAEDRRSWIIGVEVMTAVDATAILSEWNEDDEQTIALTTDEDLLDSLYADDTLVWSAGLPEEWYRRARAEQRPMTFTNEARSDDREEQRQNIEAMAQAYQMSSTIRAQIALPIPEMFAIQDRLEHGERRADDRGILWSLLGDEAVVELARLEINARSQGPTAAVARRLTALDRARHQTARDGDFSRANLDARRQNASYLQRVVGRMGGLQRQDHDEDRRDNSHYVEMDEEDDDHDDDVGLDAINSGRPDPKEEEEMHVKLECRICYSQVAEIACLPCGHLVMCSWCSDQHSPTMRQDKTRPRVPACCPVCRKNIKQKVKVFRA